MSPQSADELYAARSSLPYVLHQMPIPQQPANNMSTSWSMKAVWLQVFRQFGSWMVPCRSLSRVLDWLQRPRHFPPIETASSTHLNVPTARKAHWRPRRSLRHSFSPSVMMSIAGNLYAILQFLHCSSIDAAVSCAALALSSATQRASYAPTPPPCHVIHLARHAPVTRNSFAYELDQIQRQRLLILCLSWDRSS